MPELPEVETIKNGITPFVKHKLIDQVIINNANLRWPIPLQLKNLLPKQQFSHLTRRGKYILLHCDKGILLIHLGMTGALLINSAAHKHDHFKIIFADKSYLTFNDPRRFGAILWSTGEHKVLKHLGPEPLTTSFNSKYLYNVIKNKKIAIKKALMDNKIVVGIGNIYATEVLFKSRIHPLLIAQNISKEECQKLVDNIKSILQEAIKCGGTTIKDYRDAKGTPGYFQQKLLVYGKENHPCPNCDTTLQRVIIGGRGTVFCPRCQSTRLTFGNYFP